MIWVYGVLLGVLGAGMLLTRSYGRSFFRKLDRREHRLFWFYPLAGWIWERLGRIPLIRSRPQVSALLKSLYVKENIELERYLYQIRKISLVLAVWAASCLLGVLLCAASGKVTEIRSLQRSGYGQPSVSYEMELEYRGQEDSLEMTLDSVRYTESEILDLFEHSYEEVKRIVLGENESQEHVSKPLNLIREFDGVSIYWEIKDLDVLDYNGQIDPDLKEDEQKVTNLLATFALDEVTQLYSIPIVIEAATLTQREQLQKSIREAVEAENDIHERQVALPEEIEGSPIRFFQRPQSSGTVLLFLGLTASAAIVLLYDRRLVERAKRRKEEMMADFPEIVSKLTLLYEAGLSIHGAFERIVADYEKRLLQNGRSANPAKGDYHYAYQEMKLALEKIKNGESEGNAYADFGRRCELHAYMKLGNLLEQNLSKGAKGMQTLLLQEAEQAQEVRKRMARKKGEEAGTKLLIPMVMMLAVVIAMIAVPALMSISG